MKMKIDAQAKSLSTIFHEQNIFEIPPFQRNYSWTQDQIEEYWDDLKYTTDSKVIDYYIGQIILVRFNNDPTKNILVLDGQQRLTTTMILICSIYDYISDPSVEQDKNLIQLLGSNILVMKGKELRPRIKLNKYDEPYFRAIYDQEEFIKPSLDSHKKIKIAYEFYSLKIHEEYENGGLEKLRHLYNSLVHKFILADISCSSVEDAHLLFESMNGKGLELSKADLVKNLLFSKLVNDNDYDFVDEEWSDVIKNLNGKDVTSFLMYYWSSRYKEIRKNQIFEEFKKSISSEKSAKTILKEIKEEALNFAIIQIPESHPDKELKSILIELKLLKIEISTIIILAIFNKIQNQRERCKYLKLLSVFLFRYFTICSKPSNIILPFFCKLSKEIRNRTPDLDSFKKQLNSLNPCIDPLILGQNGFKI